MPQCEIGFKKLIHPTDMYSQSTLIYLIKKKNHAEHMQANIIQKSHY